MILRLLLEAALASGAFGIVVRILTTRWLRMRARRRVED